MEKVDFKFSHIRELNKLLKDLPTLVLNRLADESDSKFAILQLTWISLPIKQQFAMSNNFWNGRKLCRA